MLGARARSFRRRYATGDAHPAESRTNRRSSPRNLRLDIGSRHMVYKAGCGAPLLQTDRCVGADPSCLDPSGRSRGRNGVLNRQRQRPPPRQEEVAFVGAPGRIRTSGPLIRSQVLYPAELRVRRRRHIESARTLGNRKSVTRPLMPTGPVNHGRGAEWPVRQPQEVRTTPMHPLPRVSDLLPKFSRCKETKQLGFAFRSRLPLQHRRQTKRGRCRSPLPRSRAPPSVRERAQT